MIIDSKGKLFGKVSIIDILIILIVLGAAAGLLYKFTRSDTPTFMTKQDSLRIEFYVEEALSETATAIKSGDNVREFVQNTSFGKVTEVSTGESVFYAADAEGKMQLSSKKGYSSLRITMEAKGVYKEHEAIIVESSEYFIGSYITLRVGQTAVYGRITDISKIN
ncbi:MAG: DUF4330 domain-containing protein [Eubacteriales bacterium]|nr:DUF4330 domain-containing protein [Eubacteriales bacterium]